MAIELAEEHEPHLIVTEIMKVIAITLADSRRGWTCHGGEVFMVTMPTDDDFNIHLTLTVDFQ